MPASDMTIAHLSEFHLQAANKKPTGIPYEDLLDGYGDALGILDHLRKYVSDPDLFVVTGDLVLGARNAEAGYPRLLELLKQFRAEFDVPVLLAFHHPPGTIVLGHDQAELFNADELAEVISGYNVIGILTGHYHLSQLTYLAGVPCAVTKGICSSINWSDPQNMLHERKGGGYNLVHIRDERMLVRFIDITSGRETLRWDTVEWHNQQPKRKG